MADFKNYVYLLHGTEQKGKSFVDGVFKEGIRSSYGCSVHSTLAELTGENLDLNAEVLKYAQNHKGTVFVVKVPKEYCITGSFRIHSDGSVDVDNFRPVFKVPRNSEFSYFTPELIVGAYDYENNRTVSNPKYNEDFNALGLQFSDELMNALRMQGSKETDMVYADMVVRRELSYSDACIMDKAQHKFETHNKELQ